MSLRKKILLGLLALVVITLVVITFRPSPVAVSVATVQRGPLEVTVQQDGRARVRERYQLSSPVAAFHPRIDLEVGDLVKQGQELVELTPVPPQLLDRRAREQAQANVAEAQASYDFARSELARTRALYRHKDVSESTLHQAQATADRALAALQAAQALLRYTGGLPEGTPPEAVPLTSPIDGQVLEMLNKNAGTVAAGTPLLTVGNAARLEVAVDVLSTDAVQLRPGMEVLLSRWGGPTTLQGVVRTVEPSAFTKVSALGVEEQRVWVIVDFVSPYDEWRRLGDEYRVEASFVLWSGKDILQAPASALFREGARWAAFVVEGGRARKRYVEVGHRAELQVQVLGGLKEGERVITHPSSDVVDGVRVTIRKE